MKDILKYYGEEGLFRLYFFCSEATRSDFEHFWEIIAAGDLLVRRLGEQSGETPENGVTPSYDNQVLLQSVKLDNFRSNLIKPSFSRKIYQAGRHPGFLVYGLGGPRILVSHPFKGANRLLYDIYTNSVDVVSSLITRGYHGTFLFLDYLPSLNGYIHDVPEWVLWFSWIAANSDVVLFVRESGQDFRDAQKMEIDFSPDRIPKKIVELKPGELKWAKKYEDDGVEKKWIYFIPGKDAAVGESDWYAEEAKFARPFVEGYVRGDLPNDKLFVMDVEKGEFQAFPLPLVEGAKRVETKRVEI